MHLISIKQFLFVVWVITLKLMKAKGQADVAILHLHYVGVREIVIDNNFNNVSYVENYKCD